MTAALGERGDSDTGADDVDTAAFVSFAILSVLVDCVTLKWCKIYYKMGQHGSVVDIYFFKYLSVFQGRHGRLTIRLLSRPRLFTITKT